MAFKVGFHKTLFKLGKWRFGIGYGFHGVTGIIMLCIYGMLNLMWYLVLGTLWMMYGFIWLMFILPIKGISKLIKNNQSNSSSNQEA